MNVIFSAEDIDSMIAGNQIKKLSTNRKKSPPMKVKDAPPIESTVQMSIFDGGAI